MFLYKGSLAKKLPLNSTSDCRFSTENVAPLVAFGASTECYRQRQTLAGDHLHSVERLEGTMSQDLPKHRYSC
jgi:hypothetical protein